MSSSQANMRLAEYGEAASALDDAQVTAAQQRTAELAEQVPLSLCPSEPCPPTEPFPA